jgi:HK97 gp10 family phage protein
LADVKVKGIDSVTERFNKIAKMELRSTVNRATALVHGQAKALAPVDKGLLAGSIHMQVKESGNTIEGSVYTNVEYAPYVEFGTGIKGNGTYPYKIEGLSLEYTDKGWAYFSEDDGKLIFTTGQEAQPYMYPAFQGNLQTIRKMFKDTVEQKLKQSCKGG